MRILVLLRGAPGSGKSSFVRKFNLEPYTLSTDIIRGLYQNPTSDLVGDRYTSQANDNKVWGLLFQMLEERMQRGDFTIIDANHSRAGWTTRYKSLVEKYRYRVYSLTFNVSLDELLERNKHRGIKNVPADAVKRHFEFCKVEGLQKWIEPITEHQFHNLLTMQPVSYDEYYSKIHHIGDIHGCLEPLQRYVNEVGGVKPNEMWIFVGDYIDRGIQNREVLQYLFDNFLGKPNVYFLEGNHERHLRQWAFDEVVSSKEFTYHTAPQLKELDKKVVRTFTRKLGQLAYYTYNNQVVFVNHAGFPTIPSQLTPTFELIRGIGTYGDIATIHDTWNNNNPDNYFQVHGHRNPSLMPITNGRCFNLCDEVEFGGNLRVVTLDKTGWQEKSIPNTIYKARVTSQAIIDNHPNDLISSLLKDKNVVRKSMGDNIVSFNFSSKAFEKGLWTPTTVRARGLFINTTTGDIVARAWDKFFNVGENEQTSWDMLPKNMSFPANIYIKENGFLGLIGYNPENDELFIATKTTNSGSFVDYFKTILQQKGVDLAVVNAICKNGITLVFEVIDIVNDPHIIERRESDLILLAAIYNQFDYKEADIVEIGYQLNLPVKEFVKTLNSFDEFVQWYREVEKREELDFEVEGYVIECDNGCMLKVKTPYYKLWKKMRTVKDTLARGQQYNTSHLRTPEEIAIYGKLKALPQSILRQDIISVRNILLFGKK